MRSLLASSVSLDRAQPDDLCSTLSLRAEHNAIVEATVTDDCAGSVIQLGGNAVKTEDPFAIDMLMSNSVDTAAVASSLSKAN